jgi:hypothetical protein
VKPRCARNILSIWLALGVITLTSCAPVTIPSSSGANSPAQTRLGSASPSAPQPHFDSNTPVDNSQSTALTNYLHSHQLPLVGASVLASGGGARKAIVYGYVATPFGKADASDKVRQWLNDSNALVDNRIKIEPDLAGPAQSQSPMTADNLDLNNPDIQKYEAQQNREQAQQQQQYMSQGSPLGGGGMGMGFGTGGGGLTMILPLLLGGGLGLGGGGLGMGSGMGMGSPMGSPYGSPYGGSPYGGSPYGSSPYPSNPPPSGSFFGP